MHPRARARAVRRRRRPGSPPARRRSRPHGDACARSCPRRDRVRLRGRSRQDQPERRGDACSQGEGLSFTRRIDPRPSLDPPTRRPRQAADGAMRPSLTAQTRSRSQGVCAWAGACAMGRVAAKGPKWPCVLPPDRLSCPDVRRRETLDGGKPGKVCTALAAGPVLIPRLQQRARARKRTGRSARTRGRTVAG